MRQRERPAEADADSCIGARTACDRKTRQECGGHDDMSKYVSHWIILLRGIVRGTPSVIATRMPERRWRNSSRFTPERPLTVLCGGRTMDSRT